MSTSQNKRLRGAAVIVMSSIIVSRITGLIREILVPNMMDRAKSDAYTMAFKITGLMYDMLVGGAIAAALIPVLAGYIAKGDEEDGWKAAGTFINIIIVASSILCLLGMVFTKQVVNVLAVGFTGDVTKDTIDVTRILFPSVAFLMMAGLVNGVLNSYQRFAAAAYGPSIYNIGSAFSIFAFSRYGIKTVAYGVMCSSMIYFLFQLSFALKNLKYYRFRFYLDHPGFRRLFALAIPSLLSSSIVQVNVVISSSFSTFFSQGSLTAFNLADRIWQMPYGVFAQGIGIAMLPTLSADLAVGQVEKYKETLLNGLKTVLFLTIPSAAGLIILKEPVIRILQFTGKFTSRDIKTAGSVLMFFSIALLSQSIVTVINRAYYARNDTKTPLYIGTLSILFNMCLSIIFIKFTNMDVSGIALSYSMASVLNALILLLILDKKMNGIYLDRLVVFITKSITAAVIMGIVLGLFNSIPVNLDMKIMQLLYLITEVAAGAVVYFIAAMLIGIKEAVYIKNAVLNRLKIIAIRKA